MCSDGRLKMWDFCLITGSVIVVFAAGLEDNPSYNDGCGLDFTGSSSVIDGEGQLENYPWMGILLFPIGRARATSVVVLVTRQMVIGSASEIDKLPKDHFRALSRVVLGTNSSGPRIRIREYTYHSEYGTETSSSLALLQLDMDHVKFEVHPICGPPTHFYKVHIYAFSLNEDSQYPVLTIQEMQYVHDKECRRFYRRNGLDERSMWPTRTTCARALSGNECVWRGGAALAAKLGDRWHLLGFGVYGPGCRAPSRFIDYGAHVSWVKRSVERVGKPAITRLGPGHVILRRTMSSLQRFGVCDGEELIRELYTDQFRIFESDKNHNTQRVKYNVSLYDELEYSCVVFEVFHNLKHPAPFMRLRRWCAEPTNLCYGFQFIKIDFYVEIEFVPPMTFKMAAYGRPPVVLDTRLAMKYYCKRRGSKNKLVADENWQSYLNTTKHLFWVRRPPKTTNETREPPQTNRKKLRARLNDSPLDGDELFYFDTYNLNINKDYNKNQRIYNENFAQTLWGDERRQYYRYLGLHSIYNPDAYLHTTSSYGGEMDPDYTEYLSLEKKFGTKRSQTLRIRPKTTTDLQTEPINTKGTINDSPLDDDELYYFDMYNKNMEKKHNKNQRIFNESIAQTYSADERRQYYKHLGLHSLFNRDAIVQTYNEYGELLRPIYTEYLSLENKFRKKSLPTEPVYYYGITTRTTIELQNEPITTRETTNDSPLDSDELFYIDMYDKNRAKKHSKNERINNESIAQTYGNDEIRQHNRYLGFHSLLNRDAGVHTYNEYANVLRPNYTEYRSLEKKNETHSSQTEPMYYYGISTRTTTALKTEPINSKGTTNDSTLGGD